MNQELHELFLADQEERANHPAYDTPEYWALRERDARRRQRVSELLAEGYVTAPDDYYEAALIYQHGETLEEIWQAHELAQQAALMGAMASLGAKDSLWLAAATLDRWLMYQGKPQTYGTQFVPDGKRIRLWDIDPATTDAERAASHVPALREQLRQAEIASQQEAQPNMEQAPDWLKAAIDRWKHEEAE
jgi:hypothetical protein